MHSSVLKEAHTDEDEQRKSTSSDMNYITIGAK
jgi:hypothetical protein